MKTMIVLLLATCVAGSAAVGQTGDRFDGVWVQAKFIDHLKATRSVPAALKAVPVPSLPLAFVITSVHDSITACKTAPSVRDSAMVPLPWMNVQGFGKHFVFADRWVITNDTLNGQYIALYDKTNAIDTPIVYAGIPSKNRSLGFVIPRIINLSVLVGTWKDSAGASYSFYADQRATWPAGTFNYKITPRANGIHTLSIIGGETYEFECDKNTLILRVPSGKGRKGRVMVRLQRA